MGQLTANKTFVIDLKIEILFQEWFPIEVDINTLFLKYYRLQKYGCFNCMANLQRRSNK